MNEKNYRIIHRDDVADLEDVVQSSILDALLETPFMAKSIMIGVDPEITGEVYDIITERMGYNVDIFNTTTFVVSW